MHYIELPQFWTKILKMKWFCDSIKCWKFWICENFDVHKWGMQFSILKYKKKSKDLTNKSIGSHIHEKFVKHVSLTYVSLFFFYFHSTLKKLLKADWELENISSTSSPTHSPSNFRHPKFSQKSVLSSVFFISLVSTRWI